MPDNWALWPDFISFAAACLGKHSQDMLCASGSNAPGLRIPLYAFGRRNRGGPLSASFRH
jgi:hypothetical protein